MKAYGELQTVLSSTLDVGQLYSPGERGYVENRDVRVAVEKRKFVAHTGN